LVSQCTGVDTADREVTFDPTAAGNPTATPIDDVDALYGDFTDVACPSVSQCTAVDAPGSEVTFDPNAPGSPTPTVIDWGGGLNAVACPSFSQCTAVGGAGQELTFNPNAPGSPTVTTIDPGERLNAVACPSISQCTAVDNNGAEVTFNPMPPAGAVAPVPNLSALTVSPHNVSIAGRKVNDKCVRPTQQNEGHKTCRRAIKLTISYSLNVAATVTFTLKQRLPGRKMSSRCVRPTKKNEKHAHCARLRSEPGSLVRPSRAGANSFVFRGKIGGKRIGPGAYELILATTDGTQHRLTFKIVR
jgi:hypothetical protein